MLRASHLGALALVLAAPAMADVSTNPQSAPKGKYELDPSHTGVLFCIRHMGLSDYCGRFNKVSGSITFNGSQPEKSTADITIDLASVDTPSDALDGKIKDEFFEVAKHPTATFKATGIKITGKNEGEITGDLTLRGVTKKLTLKTSFNGGQAHPFKPAYMIGFSAAASFNHADFGFPAVAWRVFIGDEIKLYIEAEFSREN